jgi:hypothetical protein
LELGIADVSAFRKPSIGFDDFLGQLEDFFQELEAGEEALFAAFLDFFKALAEGDELGVAVVFAETGDEKDFDLPALLDRVCVFEDEW